MKVTNSPESDEIGFDLQVGDHRSLAQKSLNYTKVFFVESISTVPKTKVVWPQILVDLQKILFHILLGFVVPPVLCKLFSPLIMIWHPLQHLLKSSKRDVHHITHFFQQILESLQFLIILNLFLIRHYQKFLLQFVKNLI